MKISFTASPRPEAQDALRRLRHQYGDEGEANAEVLVCIGGDGQMLETLRRRMEDRKPVYGINRGTLGFLMNEYEEADLVARIGAAQPVRLRPLICRATRQDGATVEERAINEVSLFRETAQTARIRILVDGEERMAELQCDGVMVATPAGSTAYNLSAHGPIVPISARLLALTPVSPFRPRRWRGALLAHDAQVRFEVLDADRRPVSAAADNLETHGVVSVDVQEDPTVTLTMLFDPGHALEERVLREQFTV